MTGRAFFKAIPDDSRIPGGCQDCSAYQTLDRSAAPVFRLTVHHDDTCPSWRAMGGAA